MGKKRRKLMSPKYKLKAGSLRAALGRTEKNVPEVKSAPATMQKATETKEENTGLVSVEEPTTMTATATTVDTTVEATVEATVETEAVPVAKNALKQTTTRKKQSKKSTSSSTKSTTTRRRTRKKTA